jgi:hypothetical protein
MRIASAQAGEQRREQPQESIHGIAAEGTEEQIKPHHIRLQFSQLIQKSHCTEGIVERPAAQHRKVVQFRFRRRNPIGEDCQAKKRISAQFLGDVKAILA